VEPAPDAELVIVYCGVLAAEALEAFEQIREDIPGAGLLAVTSPDRLNRGWFGAQAARAAGRSSPSQIERLLANVPRTAVLVTMMDGPPTTLSWLGGVHGHRVSALGVTRFGQTGDIQDLYRAYRLDADAAVDAAAVGLLPVLGSTLRS
jgi:pyruvate dehydrogenase E1 component